MEEVRRKLRLHHYSFETERAYCNWIRKFIRFHGKKHPKDLGGAAIEAYLSHLAIKQNASASTQNQALSSILFLYKKVPGQDLSWLGEIVRAKRPVRVPVVLTRSEISRVLDALVAPHWLVATLMYGSGLRLAECLRLRVQDVDFDYLQILLRDGKGGKDRRTTLSERLVPHLKRQFDNVRAIFECDLRLN